MFSKSIKCKNCGNHISTFRDMNEYAYKLPKLVVKHHNIQTFNNKYVNYDYFCSYHCYKEALRKREQKERDRDNKRLVKKYKGILTAEEANKLEDICAIYDVTIPKIRSKQQYEKFCSIFKLND